MTFKLRDDFVFSFLYFFPVSFYSKRLQVQRFKSWEKSMLLNSWICEAEKGIKSSSQYLHLAFPTEEPPFLQPKCNFPRQYNCQLKLKCKFYQNPSSILFLTNSPLLICLPELFQKEGGRWSFSDFFFSVAANAFISPYLQMRLERKIGWGKILLLLPKWACVCVFVRACVHKSTQQYQWGMQNINTPPACFHFLCFFSCVH